MKHLFNDIDKSEKQRILEMHGVKQINEGEEGALECIKKILGQNSGDLSADKLKVIADVTNACADNMATLGCMQAAGKAAMTLGGDVIKLVKDHLPEIQACFKSSPVMQ